MFEQADGKERMGPRVVWVDAQGGFEFLDRLVQVAGLEALIRELEVVIDGQAHGQRRMRPPFRG